MDENWKVYINGAILPLQEAKISVFDMGFQYGDGVFEGMRCYDGRLFKVDEHISRLFDSARAVNIKIPFNHDEIKKAIRETIKANRFTNAHIKFILTRGNAWQVGARDQENIRPNLVIIVRPIEKSMFGESIHTLRLAVVSVRKIPPVCIDPRIKSLNYMANFLARSEAQASGADDAIMLDIQGYVSEGSGFNIFLVRRGNLLTPPAQVALEGITRQTVLTLAKGATIPTYETQLTMYDVYTAEEVFVTGSGAGIVPVIEVDKRQIGDGKPGRIALQIIDLYADAVKIGEPIE
jgi:branched-chain amino acid aminotransferase